MQKGLPFDRIKNAVADTFSLEQPAKTMSRGERSYFITRLLRNVIFAEANLVGANPREERRIRLMRLAAYGTAAAVSSIIVLAWTISFFGSREQLSTAAADLEIYRQEVTGIKHTKLSGRKDQDLHYVYPLLQRLRHLPGGYASRNLGEPLAHRFGLSQRRLLNSVGELSYQQGLEQLFLPRLLLAEEDDLRARISDIDYVLPALKVYLMLGGNTNIDEDFVTSALVRRWTQEYRDAPQAIDALSEHLSAMLALNMESYPALDDSLVRRAHETLREISLAKRAYQRFTALDDIRALPPWRLVDHGLPEANTVFVRHSGKPINEGVPGLFTYDGFHKVFLANLDDIVRVERCRG